MKKMTKIVFPLLAFASGLAAGVLLAPTVAAKAEGGAEKTDVADATVRRPPKASVKQKAVDPDAADGADGGDEGDFVEALDPDQVPEEEAETATVEEVTDEDGLTPETRAEKFKRENPEEWERIRQRRAAAFEVMRKANAEKQNFLDTIDEAHLTAEQKQEHAAFAEALAVRNAARERIRAANEDGKEPVPADYRAFTTAERTLREKCDGERRLLLEATARSLGLGNDDVADFLGILERIDACTRDLH